MLTNLFQNHYQMMCSKSDPETIKIRVLILWFISSSLCKILQLTIQYIVFPGTLWYFVIQSILLFLGIGTCYMIMINRWEKIGYWCFIVLSEFDILIGIWLDDYSGLEIIGAVLMFMPMVHFLTHSQYEELLGFIINLLTICILLLYVIYRPEKFGNMGSSQVIVDLVNIQLKMLVLHVVYFIKGRYRTQAMKELKKLMKERETSQAHNTFFASVSHELRNPLNALVGCIDILGNSQYEYDQEVMETAITCGETLLNLIGNVLDVAKIEANKLQISTEPCNVTETIQKVVNMCKSIAEHKGIFMKFQSEESMPSFLETDSTRLVQITMNILANACKFTDKGGVYVKLSWFPVMENKQIGKNDSFMQSLLKKSSMKKFLETVEEMDDKEFLLFNPKTFVQYSPSFHSKNDVDRNILKGDNSLQSSQKRIRPHIIQSMFPSNQQIPDFSERTSKRDLTLNKRKSHIQKSKPSSQNNSEFKQGYVKIQIIDTGIGIDEKNIPNLFKPFVQERQDTNKKFGGTGLGLWISKKIVQLMDGDITIDSKLKLGTNFIIVIPMQVSAEVPQKSSFGLDKVMVEGVYFRDKLGMRCLYVEEKKLYQKVTRQMLEREGFNVFSADNGKQGLEIFKESQFHPFDLVISNIKMPIMNGQQMVREIRKFEKITHMELTPIILVATDKIELEKVLSTQFFSRENYLIKPIRIAELRNALLKIFDPEQYRQIKEERKEKNIMMTKQSSGTTKKVLIIDDDSFSSGILKCFIKNAQFDCFQAFMVKEGLNILKDYHSEIGIIFLDSSLPDGSGPEAAKKIRNFETINGYDHIPLISLSGNDSGTQKKAYKGIDIAQFLVKPIDAGAIIGQLSKYLENAVC